MREELERRKEGGKARVLAAKIKMRLNCKGGEGGGGGGGGE